MTLYHCLPPHLCLSASCRILTYYSRQLSLPFSLIIDNRCHYSSRNILNLHERGIWADKFPDSNVNELVQHLTSKSRVVYSGFDPTANALHVGNLLVITSLLHCQRAGHKVIALIGGATAQVGDPSGRKFERPLIDPETVAENGEMIGENLARIFNNHGEYFWNNRKGPDHSALKPVEIVNNTSWYQQTNLLTFFTQAGRHLRLGDLMARTAVQSRIKSEEGMNFAEFSYQVLQAYDWLQLHDKFGCTLQIGGNDQMGNIVSGYQLIKNVRKVSVTGLTVPIVTNEAGNKFGKTAGNAVWLDANLTSPFDFYQFFFRLKDSEVEKYLLFYTFLPVNDVAKIMEKNKENPEMHYAQKKLAETVTLLVHGQSGLKEAQRSSQVLYSGSVDALAELSPMQLDALFKSAPSATVLLKPGMSVIEAAIAANCFIKEDDARRIIEAGGFSLNLGRITNPDLALIPDVHILPSGITLARVGKKNYYLIKWLT